MGRSVHDVVLDAALDQIALADQMHACSAEPVTYADVATYSLASATMAPGDFAKSDGLHGGRRLRVGTKTVSATGNGLIGHVALVDSVNSRVLFVTVAPEVEAATAVPFEFRAWEIDLTDPAWGGE